MAKPAIVIGDGKFATKDTKFLAYAQGDSSSRFVARELTYDRGSNITATRVASNGLVEKGRENKAHFSNNFSKASSGGGWGHAGINNLTTGQDGYDGTTNATAVFASTGGSVKHQLFLGNSNSAPTSVSITDVFTLSVHAKPNGYDHLVLRGDRAEAKASFNINTGVVGTRGSECIASSMTDVGNGFYRCQATFAPAGTISFINIGMMEADDTIEFVGNTSKGYILQDAQWELGLTATELIPTSGAAGKAGILEDQARVDYLSNSNGYLLLEPTRQNKLAYSEYFEGWASTSNATLTSNDAISPEGVKNATKLLATAGDANHQVNGESITVSGGGVSASIFAKKGNTDVVRLRFNGTTNQVRAWFDLQNGTTSVDGNGTSTITEMNNGWFLCTVTEAGNTNTSISLQVFINENLDETTFAADGDEFIYIYGAQLEEGKFSSSYIPTHGTAATRASEGLPALSGSVIDMSSFIKGDDVTLVAHWADNPQQTRDTSTGGIRLSNGDSQSGSVRIYRNNNNDRYMSVVFFGTSADSFGSGVGSGSVMLSTATPKVAVRRVRSTGVFTVYLNGSPLDVGLTDANGDFTNSNFDVTWDDLQISGGSQQKYLLIKLFDSALTNSEMASETS
jgi:hypothetical protein